MTEQVLHHMFQGRVERLPEALALSFATTAGRHQLSYAELNRSAVRLADALADVDLPLHGRVVIIADRGPALVVAMLGTLIAGGVFVVVNPSHPVGRVRQVIDAAQPAAILLDDDAPQHHRTLVADDHPHLPALSTSAASAAAQQRRRPAIAPHDPAYVAFTSGSTGRPKGIPHRHATLQQFVDWQAVEFGVSSGSRIAALAPPGFDVSFCEVFGALTRGASLHLVAEDIRNDPAALVTWLRAERISLLQIVPSHWATLLAEIERTPTELPDLSTVMFVGEALSPAVVDRSRAVLSPAPHLVNVYGPTEVVAATFHPIADLPAGGGTVPIGRAIPGREITLRDENGIVTQDEGEICIASPYLTPGYLGDESATGSRFVTYPDSERTVYRTGDLARRLPGGELLFVGRTDNQVKIRGQRVELEDVEAAVMNSGDVLAVAVDVRSSQAGAAILVAFAVPRRPQFFDPEATLAVLVEALPVYMVPSLLVPVRDLPRNANGKIDRVALAQLPLPTSTPQEPVAGDEPSGDRELAIAAIWRELLQRDDIPRTANLFRIGGDSLVATRILSRVRKQFGVRVPLAAFFDDPTIGGLASAIESAPACPAIGGAEGVRAAR